MYRQFGKSGATILLTDGVSSFDENANIVYWNPSDGNQVEAGIQSSALGLAHEIGHAVRFFQNPTAYRNETVWPYNSATGKFRVSQEEIRNIPFEQSVARQLGEPLRYQYLDAQPYKAPSVTFGCFAGAPGCN